MKKYGQESLRKSTCLSLIALSASLAFDCNATVIINEVDYDQPGVDTAEFIELYNNGSSGASLDNFSLELINGNTSSSYRNIDLSGFSIAAGGYFVVCGVSDFVANCDYSFTSRSSWLQNGSPDAIGLYQDSNLIDSLSYEGSLFPFTEGDALTASDNASDITSLSRISNGVDSNNNLADFQLGCITPGSANVTGAGDCSVLAAHAVPSPGTAWLFTTGLLGLMAAGRKQPL